LRTYQLSRLAQTDLTRIADYTLDAWGEQQAFRYLDDLEDCFERLVHAPEIGRACDRIRKGYRRLEHARHVIFYRIDRDSIFIRRILHQGMLPGEHGIGDE
jgi:toxin ParE1/3/4